jgi:hypothetical protein
MIALIKIGDELARKFYISANKKPTNPGDVFYVVDKKGERFETFISAVARN